MGLFPDMPTAATKPKAVAVNGDAPAEPEPPLYGDKPTFTYTPKDGGDNIVFPAHSTCRGEVGGKTYFEMLWEWDEEGKSNADQIFDLLRRSGATKDMKRRAVRLPEDEITVFLRAWMDADDEPLTTVTPPPES